VGCRGIDVGLVSDSSHFTHVGELDDLEGYLSKYEHGWQRLQCSLAGLHAVAMAIMRGNTADGGEIPHQVVLGLKDSIVKEADGVAYQRDRKFGRRVKFATGASGGAVKSVRVGGPPSKATTLAEASDAVEAAIGVDVESVDVQKPLPEFGGELLS
jgi:hypothetical protein